jgi:hypothetical protein
MAAGGRTERRNGLMSTLKPKGEKLRQAVRWISEMIGEEETGSIPRYIQQASERFNLSPKEEAFLTSFYLEQGKGERLKGSGEVKD